MRCRRIQKRLSAYQDGVVGGKEREQIAAHLERCPACRSAYAEMERVWQALEKIPAIEASAGLEQRLFERINAVPQPSPRGRLPWGSRGEQWRFAPAMMAVLLLVGTGVGGFLGTTLVEGFSSAPAPAQVQTSRTGVDFVSFSVFSAAPPGTLGDGYLRLAHFTKEDR